MSAAEVYPEDRLDVADHRDLLAWLHAARTNDATGLDYLANEIPTSRLISGLAASLVYLLGTDRPMEEGLALLAEVDPGQDRAEALGFVRAYSGDDEAEMRSILAVADIVSLVLTLTRWTLDLAAAVHGDVGLWIERCRATLHRDAESREEG